MQTSSATMTTSISAPSATTLSPAKPTEAATKQQSVLHQTQLSEPSILYPLASSGRGTVSAPRGLLPQFPQPITTANQHQPFFHSSSSHISSLSAPPPRPHAHPVLKAATPCFPPGNKDLKDKVADDTFFIVRDRKVRISDKASVYALCRSWLRNGYPEQIQPQYGDASKSLPRPLPIPDPTSSKRKENDDETESDEDEKTAESPRAEDLLRGHIKRAKRIRERLKEERLQRIKRYRGRLSLLLPPPVEQCRNHVRNGPTREAP